MSKKNHYLAIIPARGGSKGLKNKNICLLDGKPLISYTIEAAIKSDIFTKIVVTSDCSSILSIARGYQKVDLIERPSRLSTDEATSESVVDHVIQCYEKELFTHIVLLQPTSPLRNSKHIIESVEYFEYHTKQSLMSVCLHEHHPYKGFIETEEELKPFKSGFHLSRRRQDLPKVYRQNGAIYIISIEAFYRNKCFYDSSFVAYKMSNKESVDIDTSIDLIMAEAMLKNGDAATD